VGRREDLDDQVGPPTEASLGEVPGCFPSKTDEILRPVRDRCGLRRRRRHEDDSELVSRTKLVGATEGDEHEMRLVCGAVTYRFPSRTLVPPAVSRKGRR